MSAETTSKQNSEIPMPVPTLYHKAIQENSSLLEDLFGVSIAEILETSSSTKNSKKPGVFKDLIHFLDVYIEIFDHSAKQQKRPQLDIQIFKDDSPIVQQCITKFREIWRQGFRGFQYLSEKKLEQVGKRSELETLLKLSTFKDNTSVTEETLKQIMLLEQTWIRKVNDQKRNKDLEEIQLDAVEKFKTAVVMEFSYLFDDDGRGSNFRYCEDTYFEWKLEELIKNCENNFQIDIPFHEEGNEDVMKSVVDQLKAKLEESVLTDLKSRNNSKKIVIEEYMDSLVVKCVENYKKSITTAVLGEDEKENTQIQYETESILQLHRKFIQDSTPKFVTENGIEIGTEEYQVKCLNSFNNQTYEIFKKLVQTLNENCETNMLTCHQESKEEIQTCLAKVTDIWGRYGGMIGYSNELRSQFETGLSSVFSKAKEVNRLNKELLLTATKPVHVLTNDETNFKHLMESCKKTYTDKLLSVIKVSSKFEIFFYAIFLEECHHEAKTSVIKLIDSLNSTTLPPYLSFKLKSKFTSYVDHFITQAKAKGKTFFGLVRIPFSAVESTDTLIQYGTESQIKTRYQCITVMKEYEDKSLEELHLEDKTNNCQLFEKIMELLEQSVSYVEMHEDFSKSFKFSGSGSSLTNPSMSSNFSFNIHSSTNARYKPGKAVRRFKD